MAHHDPETRAMACEAVRSLLAGGEEGGDGGAGKAALEAVQLVADLVRKGGGLRALCTRSGVGRRRTHQIEIPEGIIYCLCVTACVAGHVTSALHFITDGHLADQAAPLSTRYTLAHPCIRANPCVQHVALPCMLCRSSGASALSPPRRSAR